VPRIPIPLVEERPEEYGPFPTDLDAANFARAVGRASSRWKRSLGVADQPLKAAASGASVRLHASRVTGVVPVGWHELNIIPKYLTAAPARAAQWGTALLRMLSFSSSSNYIVVDNVSTRSSTTFTFIDLLARSYASALSTALSEGVPRGYRRRSDRQPVLRGRLRVDRLYPGVLTAPHKLPCEYNEFVADTPVTRLLKWAAVEFSRLVTRSSLADQLLSVAALLPEVTPSVPSLPSLDRLTLSPQYRHCEPAMRIALWLARGKGGRYGDGEKDMPGILLDSAMVFEKFVIEVIKRVCLLRGWKFRRAANVLAEPVVRGDKRVRTKPDGQILVGGKVALVVDAKYKPWLGKPTPENTYQIMAGGRVLACERVALIYPSPGETHTGPMRWRLMGAGHPEWLNALFVDPILMADPDGVQKITDALGREIDEALGP
jgi:5-methylcytosine-specific restriction endonuclease McrBC regulatory subunit McrC